MGNNKPLFAIILLCLIAVDVSRASFLDNFRKLAAKGPTESTNKTDSPLPSPVSGGSKPSSNKSKDNSTVAEPPSKGTEVKKDNPPAPPPASKEKEVNKDNTPVTPPASKEKEVKKDDGKGVERTNETCDGAEPERLCKDSKSMVACVKEVDNVANVVVLLVQNKGDKKLKVHFRTSSAKEEAKQVEVPKHMAEKVNISTQAFITGIVLNAGDGDCVFQPKTNPPTTSSSTTATAYKNFVNSLPSYRQFMTPIYGACLLLGLTLITVGVFGCCMLRRKKKRQGGEIPYQELEMGGTGTGVVVETADGWDQGWDDDWDDEKAVRSPSAIRSISANGLTTRASKKEGWEDWDE